MRTLAADAGRYDDQASGYNSRGLMGKYRFRKWRTKADRYLCLPGKKLYGPGRPCLQPGKEYQGASMV